MQAAFTLALLASSAEVMAEACVVHTQAEHLDVQVCQQNISIPQQLFHDGFCEPNLPGQMVTVAYVDQCPAGAFGVCSQAHVDNMPYRQDIHYYGVASDAAYLRPFCEQKSQGKWLSP